MKLLRNRNQKDLYLLIATILLGLIPLVSCNSVSGALGSPDSIPPVIPDPETARDFILTYLNRKYELPTPGTAAGWQEADLISDPDAPSQAVSYLNNDFTLVISYPKDTPDARLYNITVRQRDSGFRWNGLLDAGGKVTEISVEMATVPPTASPTPLPTKTSTPTDTPTTSPSPLPTTTPSPAPTRTPTATPDPCNWGSFVGDITIPDGTSFFPVTKFTKIWRLKNIGSCTWNREYNLVFVRGDLMDSPRAVSIPRDVPPGGTVDLAVNMQSPQQVGEYRGFWMLRTPEGVQFGLGAAANLTFWTTINVVESLGDSRYDFSLGLCAAIWHSETGRLTCSNLTDDPDGYVRTIENPELETGKEDEIALWMHPNDALYGWINGTYPYFTVEEGDRFVSSVGCLGGYGACNLVFYLDYEDADGRIYRLGRWHEVYDGAITKVEIDLSKLAGKSVRFILGVEANIQDTEDAQGFWLYPHIENPNT